MRTLIAAALVLATATTVGASTTSAQVPTGLEPCTNPGEGVKTFASGPPIKVCDVPAGITHLNIEAWGGQGGDSQHTFSVDRGGPGGYANRLALEATPGLTPVIVVANAGGNSSRADTTGGGGGGSSGVYTSYPAQSLAEVIAIAPGGGGAGCDDGGAGGGIDRITGDGAGQPGFYQNCSKTGDDSAKYNVGRGGANGGEPEANGRSAAAAASAATAAHRLPAAAVAASAVRSWAAPADPATCRASRGVEEEAAASAAVAAATAPAEAAAAAAASKPAL